MKEASRQGGGVKGATLAFDSPVPADAYFWFQPWLCQPERAPMTHESPLPPPQMWVMTLRVMDDVKESVRRVAAITARWA
jgi:hypothetical protein